MAVTSKRVISQSGKVLDAASLVEEKDRRREARERTEQKRQAEQAQKRQDAFNAFNNAVNPGVSEREVIWGIERNQAWQAEQEAKRQYEAYRNSPEYTEKANRRIWYQGDEIEIPVSDPTHDALRSTADYYRAQREALEDRHQMEVRVAEVEAMDPADQILLKTYASGELELFDTKKISAAYTARAELEKKYGKQKVQELAEAWRRYQNELYSIQIQQDAAKAAEGGFLLKAGASFASVMAKTAGELTTPIDYLRESLQGTGQFRTLDPNNTGSLGQQFASGTREAVSEDMGGAGKVLYHGTMGAVDNLVRIAMGGGTKVGSLGLAALGSFGSTLSEASAQGATPAQAVGKAVLSAGIEVATEKVPLDELFKAGKSGYKGAKAAFKQALKQGGIEATEEEISLLGNVLVDALVMREKSSYNQQIGELVANGMSYADAKAQADRALWDEAVNTALTSFVSGGVMSGAQSGGQYIAQRQQDNARYKADLNRDIQAMMQRESAGNATVSKTEAVGEENAPTEKPQTITDEQIREAMNELYPREKTGQERMDELETEMDRMINGGELTTEEGQSRYQALSQEWEKLNNQEEAENAGRADSLATEEAPPERAMPEYAGANERIFGNPLAGRTEESVGSRSVKAYQYENPEVKPYFQDAARGILSDINNSMPGQRTFDEKMHYQSGGEKGWSGNKRVTTDDLAEIKDTYGYTWDELREAAEDIIHDRGRENNAASKRLEFLIHDRLANGYTDVEGRLMPANREYLDFLEEREINEYRREGIADLMANAERYAPQGAAEGFEAMGAASRGFSGMEAYNELLTDENVQPVRPWAVREMEVPKADAEGRRVTEFAANAAGAAATSDAVADTLAQLIGEGAMSFESRGKQQSINNAVSELEKRPISEVVGEIAERVSEGTIKDGDIEKALVAYNLLSNDGTADGQARAAAMLPMLGKMANISGRNLNMFGILKKLDPNMQVQAVQDDINRTVKELNKKRSGGSVIEGEQMRINEDLAEVFKEAETEEEKAKALDDIYKDIASRIKPTVWEMWDAWRNLAMLGNFKTHIRNIFGSGSFRPAVNAKRIVGAALERVFVDQENRTKALIGTSAQDKALLAWAKQDAESENIQKMMQYSGTTGNEARSAIEEQRRYLPGKLEDARRFNMEKMEQADMAWKKREYALALAGFLKARGYTAKQAAMDIMTPGGVPTEVMDEARSYAAKEAMKATFNDRNRFSDAVARLRVKGNKPLDRAANIVLKGILPFTRTPANVLVRAVEYSPAGLAEGFRQLAQDVKTGDATVADGLDKIASGLTGTGAMVLGAALAYGLIPGVKLIGRLDEEEKEEDPNAIEYSLKIGDKYYGISWLAPGAIPLLIGANFYQSIQDKEEITDGWDVLSALGGTVADTLDPLLELSMLSSLNDLVETVRYEDSPGEMALAAVTNAATNYFTQGLPTLFGQIEQATEKTKSSVYSNADNPMQRSFERTVGRATQRIPGVDLYQTERMDAEGNPVENGPWYQRAFDAIINPFTHSESGTTPVTKELTRLDVTAPTVSKTVTYTDDQGNKREDYRLSAEEFSTMQRLQLGNSNRIMSEMLESSDYEKLPDELKEKALEYVKDYARELARGEVLPGYDGKSSWMEGIEGKEAAAIIGKVAGGELSDAMTALATGWREGYEDDSGALEGLESAAKTYEALTPEMQKAVKEGLSGRVAAYLEAKAKGMETETFANLYRKYWDIDQSGSGASEQAAKWAYELERAEERREITAQQKATLKNSLRFYQNFPAETEKFDRLTESGLSADEADDLGWLLKGLKVQEGYKEVRDIQKAEAITKSTGLSEADKIAALKIYGTDAQDENLDLILEMGGTADDYVAAWQMYTNASGEGKKRRTILAYMERFKVDWNTAAAIYDIYG